jgi:hypothetical protein
MNTNKDAIAYLGSHVFERYRADNREAQKENVGVSITQRSKTIVFFLSSCIPQSKFYVLLSSSKVDNVVVKDLPKLVLSNRDPFECSELQIPNFNKILMLHSWILTPLKIF